MSGIIWLASYPKSGNTWLRAFLANYLTKARRPVAINDLPNHILGDNMLLHYEQFTGRKSDELTDTEVARLRPAIHRWFAESSQNDVFVKTHNVIAQVDGAPLITPSATVGAIYVVRNPMDVAVSFAHHYQVDYARAVESLGEENYCLPPTSGLLPQYLGSWSGHVRSWIDAPGLTLHLMHYEDMLKKPLATFGRLTKFLGFRRDPARLRRAIRFSSFGELSAQERETRFVEARPDDKTAFFRSGAAGAWREVLTDDQVEALVSRNRALLVRLGYLREDGTLAEDRSRVKS